MKDWTNSYFGATFATLLLLSVTTGCNQKPATGEMSGKVTFQDMPIAQGTIAFISKNGRVASGNIELGAYTASGAEVGPDASVTITSHPPSPMVQPPTGQVDGMPVYPPGKFVRIPERYGDSKVSGLTYDVVEGTQTYDVDLEP